MTTLSNSGICSFFSSDDVYPKYSGLPRPEVFTERGRMARVTGLFKLSKLFRVNLLEFNATKKRKSVTRLSHVLVPKSNTHLIDILKPVYRRKIYECVYQTFLTLTFEIGRNDQCD